MRHTSRALFRRELYVRAIEAQEVAAGGARSVQRGLLRIDRLMAIAIGVLLAGVLDARQVEAFGTLQAELAHQNFGMALIGFKANAVSLPCYNSIK
jgi:hypothetical protein